MNKTLEQTSPDNVKISVSNDDISIKSNSKSNQTLIFTEKSLFCTVLGFTRSHSFALDDIHGFYQLIAGSYRSEKPIKIKAIEKIHLKCDCIQGSIVNGIREHILYRFALDKPPDHKIKKEPRNKLFRKLIKPVLSHMMFYLEDDDHKPVDFNNETVSFICQLIKI